MTESLQDSSVVEEPGSEPVHVEPNAASSAEKTAKLEAATIAVTSVAARGVYLKYEQMVEKLISFYTREEFKEEVADARREFFDEAGVVDEEDHHFEMRMTQFLEWYLFTRKLKSKLCTPAWDALGHAELTLSQEERVLVENLASSKHSLFEFLRIRGEDISVMDLFSKEQLVIPASPVQIGFSREEFFDSRLIRHGDMILFMRGFAFHPEEAAGFIRGEVEQIQNADAVLHEALILRLLKMRYKYEQYRHLKLEHVYTNERKVRF